MVKWYLATYQNGAFSSDLGIIQPSGDYVYKLKNPIESTKSPVKSDWLRISITNTDNTVKEWDGNDWNDPDEDLTGLVNNSTYWVYGKPYSYKIVTNDQTYYLKSFSSDQNENTNTRIITGKDINDSDVSIDDVTPITAVTIGPSVTTIGDQAFALCANLASLTIGDSVTTIGEGAFQGCASLKLLTIGEKVETIGDGAFYQCSSLVYVTMGDSVDIIGNGAFSQCSSLASLIIGNSVETIGEYAFYECTSLKSVNIPDSVETIGDFAFYECTSLESVTIGNSVKIIGDYAFGGCTNLASVNIPDSVTKISDVAFGVSVENISNDDNTIITISQSTVRRLMESDTYDSGNQYPQEIFFSGSTNVTLIVT